MAVARWGGLVTLMVALAVLALTRPHTLATAPVAGVALPALAGLDVSGVGLALAAGIGVLGAGLVVAAPARR